MNRLIYLLDIYILRERQTDRQREMVDFVNPKRCEKISRKVDKLK